MLPLAELEKRAQRAVQNLDLIRIAFYATSPSTALKAALILDWPRDLALSCQFMAAILRDYELGDFWEFVKDNNIDAYHEVCNCDCHDTECSVQELVTPAKSDCDCCQMDDCWGSAHTFDEYCRHCGVDCSDQGEIRGSDDDEADDDSEEESSDDQPGSGEDVDISCDENVAGRHENRVRWIMSRILEAGGSNYPIVIVDSRVDNAYATGSIIKINTGLLNAADDDEVAFILCHEIAHNDNAHVNARRARLQEGGEAIAEVFDKSKGVISGVIKAVAASVLVAAVHSKADRDEELGADTDAKDLAERAGFDSSAGGRYLMRDGFSPDGIWQRIFASHPSAHKRLENLS